MKKTILLLGVASGLSIPLQVLAYTYDYDSFAIKRNPLPQNAVFTPIYAAGYHCSKAVYNKLNVGEYNVAGFGQAATNYTGVGYSTNSLDEAFTSAKADCQNNKINNLGGRNSWTNNFSYDYSTFLNQVKEYDQTGTKLEAYSTTDKTHVGEWYCAVPGYQSGYSFTPLLRYGGAVGYGETQSDALAQMKKNFLAKNSPKSSIITPPAQDPLIYQSYNLLDYPYCGRVGVFELAKINTKLTAPTITLSQYSNPQLFIEGSISNLEDTGSDVKYSCYVSDSMNGIYTEVPRLTRGPDGSLNNNGCVVGLGDNNFFIVRAPILGTTDKWIKIQAKRLPTINGDGVSDTTPLAVYSNPIKIPAIKTETFVAPRQPQLTVSYSDSKIITSVVSNLESPVTDYNYSCVYTSKENANRPSLIPDQVTSFADNSSICALNYNENNHTMTLTVNLLNSTEALKDKYFAVMVYKKSMGDPAYSSFSRALPFASIPCEAPTSADFGNIDKTLLKNYNLSLPFKSTRTLTTQAAVLGWDKQTLDFTKVIPVTSSTIADYIDKADQNGFYDYHVYNVCEGNVKSQSYCLIRVFNPSKYPNKDALICTSE